jgi:uncharacterized protein
MAGRRALISQCPGVSGLRTMHPDLIEQLGDPGVYPDGPERVEIVQTHLSVVALAGDFAYKWKKSIRLPFADFSTLGRRKFFCEEELRLNRRLCPAIYLEVCPLRRADDGQLAIGGAGEIIDYAVKMRRLPAADMLDVRLAENRVTPEQIRDIARRVAAFHRAAVADPEVTASCAPEKLREFALANFAETRGAVDTVFHPELHAALEKQTITDFARLVPVLSRRRNEGRVVDGHGDLHARNICLTDPVAIYDCIDFEPAFRRGDVATEHAFLIMDLRFRGHPELAEVYLREIVAATGDREMESMIPALARYRAMVRAKVSAITSGEKEISGRSRREAGANAARYLRLAAALAVEERGPVWLALCGLPGTGKSTLAGELHDAGSWTVLSSDRIRKELAGVAEDTRLPDSAYSAEFSHRTYAALFVRAAKPRPGPRVVVLDANFRDRAARAAARAAAAAHGAGFVLAPISISEAEACRRLDARTADVRQASDADRAVYEKLKRRFEPVDAGEADLVIPLDGDQPAACLADLLLARWLNA